MATTLTESEQSLGFHSAPAAPAQQQTSQLMVRCKCKWELPAEGSSGVAANVPARPLRGSKPQLRGTGEHCHDFRVGGLRVCTILLLPRTGLR
jgi:hypothetical protein